MFSWSEQKYSKTGIYSNHQKLLAVNSIRLVCLLWPTKLSYLAMDRNPNQRKSHIFFPQCSEAHYFYPAPSPIFGPSAGTATVYDDGFFCTASIVHMSHVELRARDFVMIHFRCKSVDHSSMCIKTVSSLHHRCSTYPLVFGCWELSHVIFLKLRNKELLPKLSKFTKWQLFSLQTTTW